MHPLRDDGRYEPELPVDFELAIRFGAYASYVTPNDPTAVDFHGESPATEMDRLLDRLCGPTSIVLDLGCGAGFTLARLARSVSEIWGVDLQSDLLGAARQRTAPVPTVRLLHGDTTNPALVDQLPDDRFTLAFSRRGPFLTESLAGKLTPDALFVVELAQDFLGLKELFGRTPFLPRSSGDPDPALAAQAAVGYVPVSAKTYWFEEWFADAAHLARYLRQGAALQNWWMEPCPYEEPRDRDALELYARYNRADKGIRLIGQRKIYVFRRQITRYYPVLGGG